jgi:ferritin-like metal-binding protein YciE
MEHFKNDAAAGNRASASPSREPAGRFRVASAPRTGRGGFRGHLLPRIARTTDMAKTKTLEDLFLDTLKDIYYAEKRILKALPKMKRAARDEKLVAAFEKHRDETEGQIDRLERIFETLNKAARGKRCDAIEGIISEAEEIIEEFKDSPALDAGLISAAQAVEHYEITRYGTLHRWATELGMKDAAKLLDTTLQQEWKTDEDLTKLADATVNDAAKASEAA